MIEEYFSTVSSEDDWNPRYNVAPTQAVPVIRQNPKEPRRELSLLRWDSSRHGKKTHRSVRR
jgi:putative SOS response-associated peptidase YedK